MHKPLVHNLTKSLHVRYCYVHLGMRKTESQGGKGNLLTVTVVAQATMECSIL